MASLGQVGLLLEEKAVVSVTSVVTFCVSMHVHLQSGFVSFTPLDNLLYSLAKLE